VCPLVFCSLRQPPCSHRLLSLFTHVYGTHVYGTHVYGPSFTRVYGQLQIILFDAINQPSLISSHFEFKSADNLEFTCPKCAHVNDRGTDATVTELILSISEFKDFRRALQSWESVESLNCDNTPGNLSGIECEGPGCSNRCAVKKFTCLKALPSFTFNIILQRLEFDMTTLTRKKVTTAFDIPTILEVKPGLSSTWDSPANNNSPTKFYLTSILLHSGTANGGHYYSMHRQIDNTWSKCNDSVVTNFTTEEFMKVLPVRRAKRVLRPRLRMRRD